MKKYILKSIAVIIMIFVCSSMVVFAETEPDVWLDQGDITVYTNDSWDITAGVSGNETMSVYWARNDYQIYEYTNENFLVEGKRFSRYRFYATEEMVGYTYKISFVIHTSYGKKEASLKLTVDYPPEYYEQKNVERVLREVTPANVTAVVNTGSTVYSDRGLTTKLSWVNKNTTVIYDMQHVSVSAHIIMPNGTQGWVPFYNITPSSKNFTVYQDFSLADKNTFVNAKGYTSDTNYLVFINIQRQRVNVFLKTAYGWSIEKVMKCASGTNRLPTVKGVFKYFQKDSIWDFGATCVKPALRFYGSYAMHSVILNKNGTVNDGTLGTPASHGCVRLAVNDINWLSNHLPKGSTIVVY